MEGPAGARGAPRPNPSRQPLDRCAVLAGFGGLTLDTLALLAAGFLRDLPFSIVPPF